MQIDHDKNGYPRAMLVSVSLAESPDPDGKFFTVFIPIDQILALRETDKTLVGHPWLDVPSDEIIGQKLTKSQYDKFRVWLKAKRFIAISATGERGKLSRGVKLDKDGQPIVRYVYSWRDPRKYLTKDDIWWLEQMEAESFRYSSAMYLVIAIAEYFQRLQKRLSDKPKPKVKRNKKLKRKERRQREYEEITY